MKKPLLSTTLIWMFSMLIFSGCDWQCTPRDIKVNSAILVDNWTREQITEQSGVRVSKIDSAYIFIDCYQNDAKPDMTGGSIYMTLPILEKDEKIIDGSVENPNRNLVRLRLKTNIYSGVKLSDFRMLKYRTLSVSSSNNQVAAPSIYLVLELQLPLVKQGKPVTQNIVYSPINSLPERVSPVVFNQWQEWDAFNASWEEGNLPPGQLPRLKNNSFNLKQYLDYFKDLGDIIVKEMRFTSGVPEDNSIFINSKIYLDGIEIRTSNDSNRPLSGWVRFDFIKEGCN